MSERSENETTFRFDDEERVLWACTCNPPTAARWKRAGYAVTVLGTVGGEPRTWQVKLPSNQPGWRQAWRQLVVKAIPGWPSFAAGGPADATDENGTENVEQES